MTAKQTKENIFHNSKSDETCWFDWTDGKS